MQAAEKVVSTSRLMSRQLSRHGRSQPTRNDVAIKSSEKTAARMPERVKEVHRTRAAAWLTYPYSPSPSTTTISVREPAQARRPARKIHVSSLLFFLIFPW